LENLDFALINQSIYGGGLFATRKFVLINGLPLDSSTKLKADQQKALEEFTDHFIKSEGRVPEDLLLVFVNSSPDKRLRLCKFLEKNATVKEFAQLKENDLEEFIRKELADFIIDHDTIEYLLTKIGTDMYHIRFECDKLRVRAQVK
jgi:DNA polymerase III delta subunit